MAATAIGALAAAVAVAGLAACGSPAHPAGQATHSLAAATSAAAAPSAAAQLTVAQATSVFTGFLPKFGRLPTDPSLASQLTTGPLAAGEAFLKGGAGPSVSTLSGEHVLVPNLTGFPRWFLADGTATSGQGFLFVMLQPTAGAQWRAAAEFFDQSSPGQILPDLSQAGMGASDQYSPVPASDPSLQPSGLAAAYARYLNQPGSAATRDFNAGTYTSQRLRSNQQTARQALGLGWKLTDSMTTTSQPSYGISLPSGAGTLVIFFTGERYTWTARSAAAVINRGAAASLATPPDVFLRQLGIRAASAGLRVTLRAIDQNLAFIGPPGTKAVVVVNNGLAVSLAKS